MHFEKLNCSAVRSFLVDDIEHILLLDLSDDSTSVINEEGQALGLRFDSSTYIYLKGICIGKLRLPFPGEPNNIHFIKYNAETEPDTAIDTGVYKDFVECYLDAEVFVTKYLIENNIITLEKENVT